MIKASVILKDDTSKILRELQDKAVAFVTQGGSFIRENAIDRVPVDTGVLKGSIQTESFIEDGIPVSETGPNTEYAAYVEYGTSKMKAQPYMEPGYRAAIPKINGLRKLLAL